MSELTQEQKARYFDVLESGFVKSIENTGDAWEMVWWDDDANEHSFTRPSLRELIQAFDDFCCGEIPYAALKATVTA